MTSSTTVAEFLSDSVDKLTQSIGNLFSERPRDTVAAIEEDHEGLRNFLKILKDTDAEMSERRRAYTQFAALLKSHSTIEESVVYKRAKELTGREMHIKVAEGYVEHQVANDLMARIEATKDATEWSAHANVLSESVEHHLKEEERDLLPLIRKQASPALDKEMLDQFLAGRRKTQRSVTKKNAGVLKDAA